MFVARSTHFEACRTSCVSDQLFVYGIVISLMHQACGIAYKREMRRRVMTIIDAARTGSQAVDETHDTTVFPLVQVSV